MKCTEGLKALQGWTKVPNELFKMIPQIGDVELRMMLVIVRLTNGWRQKEVNLSLNQLAELSGRSKSSVVRATNSLSRRGLIGRRKNLSQDGQTESTYWIESEAPDPPLAQGNDAAESSVAQAPDPTVEQPTLLERNYEKETVKTSPTPPPEENQKNKPSPEQLECLFLTRYKGREGKLDWRSHDKIEFREWLAEQSEFSDQILAAVDAYFDEFKWAAHVQAWIGFRNYFYRFMERSSAVRAVTPANRSHEGLASTDPQIGSGKYARGRKRNYLEEWNRLVPEQPTQFNSRKNVLLIVEAAGENFPEHFDKICEAARMVITAKGANASYLDLYWVCKYAEGESKPNWWRLLVGNLRHMRGISGAKSADGPWKPGMLPVTEEHEEQLKAWRADRRAAGQHTDPDLFAEEQAKVESDALRDLRSGVFATRTERPN